MLPSLEALEQIFTRSPIEKYYAALLQTLEKYGIMTPARICAFLAQIGHESDEFRAVEEYASGIAYEGRKDLGNTQKGDGIKYKGRGLIQITGRANYAQMSKDLGIDFIKNPHRLKEPFYACLSAGWYWDKHKLNTLADAGDFKAITKKINGGYNGLDHRTALYKKAKGLIW